MYIITDRIISIALLIYLFPLQEPGALHHNQLERLFLGQPKVMINDTESIKIQGTLVEELLELHSARILETLDVTAAGAKCSRFEGVRFSACTRRHMQIMLKI